MSNYKCVFSYVGTNLHGSAEQVGIPLDVVPTVVGKMRFVIELVAQSKVDINLAGRTDKGVHARAQVANFVFPGDIDSKKMIRALNSKLSPEITVHTLEKVDPAFHARFSATARTYRYYIYNAENQHTFYSAFTWHIYNDLNLENMIEASKHFLGEHDFTTFCRTNPAVKNNIRNVQRLDFYEVNKSNDLFNIAGIQNETNSRLLCVEIKANAFCWQMVRSIVGTLVDVGRGVLSPNEIVTMLEAKDRSVTKQLAISQGLTLYEIDY
ncbi:MAG: tRNA pseudouridine(38-40) synthase TruA [Acidimicrobiia bacterium]